MRKILMMLAAAALALAANNPKHPEHSTSNWN